MPIPPGKLPKTVNGQPVENPVKVVKLPQVLVDLSSLVEIAKNKVEPKE